MPRPFGVWAPATTIAELRARSPRWTDFKWKFYISAREECWYSPSAMAHFKDPQQFKDAVDYCRRLAKSDLFFGFGMQPAKHHAQKIVGCMVLQFLAINMVMQYYYHTFIPAHNPSWRKIMNKEWDEAINNSPWDHRSHVWNYCDVYGANMGNACTAGRKKFYIPA